MKAVKAKCKIWKRKQTKTHLIEFKMFIFYKTACLQKNFQRWVLLLRVFSFASLLGQVFFFKNIKFPPGNYQPHSPSTETLCYLNNVSLLLNTIASRDQFKPVRARENLVVNYNPW